MLITSPNGRDFMKLWKTAGWGFTKLLTQIRKIFVTLGLKILRLFKLKVFFLKQISLKGDVNYCINHKVSISYEKLLHKSTLKLQKPYKFSKEVLWIPSQMVVNNINSIPTWRKCQQFAYISESIPERRDIFCTTYISLIIHLDPNLIKCIFIFQT